MQFLTKGSIRRLLRPFILLGVVFSSTAVHAQLTGTKNIPGDYADLNTAITALNAQGVGAGGVTLNLLINNPQVAPAGGYAITAQGTAANPIVLAGNHNFVSAASPQPAGSFTDAIFKIVGGDYITIKEFSMQEDYANSDASPSTNNMTEWGIALLQGSVTNGAQHNTITGNTISLLRTYENSMAIYSNTRHSATNAGTSSAITNNTTAPNSFNLITANTIDNVNFPVMVIGSATVANYDEQNVISFNTISYWSGTVRTSAYIGLPTAYATGIYLLDQNNYSITDNNIQTSTACPAYDLRIIMAEYAGAPATATNNTIARNSISYTLLTPAGSAVSISTIGTVTGSGMTLNVTDNIIHDCLISSGVASNTFGIYNSQVVNVLNVTGNTWRNNTDDGSGGWYGIANQGAVTTTINISNNYLGDASGGAVFRTDGFTGSPLYGIYNTASASGAAITINGNDFRGFTSSPNGNSPMTFIQVSSTCFLYNINNNTFTNLSIATGPATITFFNITGSMFPGATMNVNSNSIVGTFTKTGNDGALTIFNSGTSGSSTSSCTKNARFNNFSNITVAGSCMVTGWSDVEGSSSNGPLKNISDNTFTNWTCGTGTVNVIIVNKLAANSVINGNTISGISATGNIFGPVTGITLNSNNSSSPLSITNNTISDFLGGAPATGIQVTPTGTMNISGNVIHGFSAFSNNPVTGISAISSGMTINITKNKIYDLQGQTNQVFGMSLTATGSTNNVSNNFIGDLRAIDAASSQSVTGININGPTAADLNSNTIYLSGTSTANGFGTMGIYAGTSTNLTMRNNLVVNLCTPTGSGRAIAYRRSSNSLTSYQTVSDNNSFYAGVPSATHMIFFDGFTGDQTLSAYKTRVAPRDANAVTVNPTFASTTGSSPQFLHFAAGTANALESGGVVVSGFTTDYDNDARPGPAGSIYGFGTAPDIGADEFDGIHGCTTPITGTTVITPSANCGPASVTLSLNGNSEGLGISYQWKSSSTAGGPYTPISGATTVPYSAGTVSATTYYICQLTCATNSQAVASAEGSAVINPVPATPTIFSNSPVCSGNALSLAASTVAGATYSWTGPNAFTSSLQNPTIGFAFSATAGTYSLTVTVNGCTSAVATTTVVVNQTPAFPTISTNAPVCEGTSFFLSTSQVSGATYSWSGPNGFSSSSYTNTISNPTTANAGTYSVTVSANGCTAPVSTTSITIHALPAAPSITTNAPFCAGGTLLLSTTSLGPTYTWSGPGSYSASVRNPSRSNATAAMSGTYSLTVADGNGCVSPLSTASVTINPIPSTPVLNAPPALCTGNTLNMNTPVVSGATYAWSGPNSFTSSVNSPVITNLTTAMAGTYSVTVTTNGCTSAPGTATVAVNVTPATPAVTGNSPVCSGNTINLSMSNVSGGSYYWADPNTNFLFTQNLSLTNASTAMSGTYMGFVVVNGCTSAPATTSVVVNQTPATPAASGSSPVCTGNTINLSTGTVSGATYAWSGPNSFSSSTQNPVLTNATTAMTGTYSVTVTANGCTSGAGTTSVVVNTTPATPFASGGAPVCAGNTISLSTPVVPGADYSWTGPNGFFSSDQNPTIGNADPIMTGTYSLTVTANGCTSGTGTTNVTVNTLPVVAATATATVVCTGSNVTLSGTGATTYTWTGGVTDNVAFPVMANDTYTVTGTDANGCQNTDEISIYVYQLPVVTATCNATTVCAGTNVMLTGSGAMTYAWTGGVTNNTAFPAMTTETYTVTGTDVSGCTDTATITIMVNPLPVVVAVTADTTVCYGTSVTMSGSGANTYYWYAPMTGISDNVPFTATHSDVFTVTGVDANGCTNTDVITLTVNPLPVVTANVTDNSICDGTSVIFTGSGSSDVTYSWTSSVSGNPVDSVAFTPTMSDTYIVTATDTNGCQNTDQIVVNVYSLPNLLANATATSVCAGTSVTLYGTGAPSYSWSGGVTDNVAFTPTMTNTYTLTGTDQNGCHDSTTVTITVNALPTVALSLPQDTACQTIGLLTLSGETPAGGSWSGSGVTGNTFDPMASGTGMINITYQYTDGNGCAASATDSIWVDICNGISTAAEPTDVTLYPNPNNGQFTIQLSDAPHAPVQVDVLNALGQIVQTFSMNSGKQQVDISAFDNGVYLVRVIRAEGIRTYHVVKQ